jgi:hypothetical protein
MKSRAKLIIVTAAGIQRLAKRERLIEDSKRLFPTSPQLASKWVDAKLALGERKPSIQIGINRVDTTRAVRTLPIGSVGVKRELPWFLRRFIKR